MRVYILVQSVSEDYFFQPSDLISVIYCLIYLH